MVENDVRKEAYGIKTRFEGTQAQYKVNISSAESIDSFVAYAEFPSIYTNLAALFRLLINVIVRLIPLQILFRELSSFPEIILDE